MAHQVSSIDYGDYRYRVGDIIRIAPGKEYLYPTTTGNSYTSTPNISKDVRKITQIWASDENLSVSNPPLEILTPVRLIYPRMFGR